MLAGAPGRLVAELPGVWPPVAARAEPRRRRRRARYTPPSA